MSVALVTRKEVLLLEIDWFYYFALMLSHMDIGSNKQTMLEKFHNSKQTEKVFISEKQ